MKTQRATLFIASITIASFAACFACAAQGVTYSKLVQQACGQDYHKFCADYGLDSPALRSCMDRAGKSLSHGCVHALIQSGEVSQAEVDRRK